MKSSEVLDEYKELQKRLGENIARARKEAGLSQRKLAEVAGISQTQIAKVESYPPLDMTLRSVFDVVRELPVGLGAIISRSELRSGSCPSNLILGTDERLVSLFEQIASLDPREQDWIADVMSTILTRAEKTKEVTGTECTEHLKYSHLKNKNASH